MLPARSRRKLQETKSAGHSKRLAETSLLTPLSTTPGSRWIGHSAFSDFETI
jgi:hypothetical protein